MPLDDRLEGLARATPEELLARRDAVEIGGCGICPSCERGCWNLFPLAVSNMELRGVAETPLYSTLTETFKLREYALLKDGRVQETYDGILRELGLFGDFMRRQRDSPRRPGQACIHSIEKRLASIVYAKTKTELIP